MSKPGLRSRLFHPTEDNQYNPNGVLAHLYASSAKPEMPPRCVSTALHGATFCLRVEAEAEMQPRCRCAGPHGPSCLLLLSRGLLECWTEKGAEHVVKVALLLGTEMP